MKKLWITLIIIIIFLNYSTVNAASLFSAGSKNEQVTRAQADPIQSSLKAGQVLNVRDFGAKGDGITDDAASIQNAIDVASQSKAILLFPESASYYKINNTLLLKDNTTISGYGATIFMGSQSDVQSMIGSNDENYISSVTVEGISLKSNNDRNGTDYLIDSLTSNVIGIYIQGVFGKILVKQKVSKKLRTH